MRVAAAQFAVTNDVEENLQTCLRMLKKAGECEPDLIVFPEFCNHNSWYDDKDHCYQVSVDIGGDFLSKIAAAVKEVGAYLSINCTVRRANNTCTGTSMMFSPEGELLGQTNKQVLIGHENDFLERATEQGPQITTPFGKLAMYSCMDGVINETPRCLALSGAQVLCNNLNSFAIDEGNLHIPVRAAENKVFVVAANKVGPLIPAMLLEPISEAINIPVKFLSGAGDSQIVAPDGTVLAIAGQAEEVIFADIDPSQADSKLRPDGTDIFVSRRPELYQALGQDPAGQPIPTCEGSNDLLAAAVSATASADALIALQQAQDKGSKLICLPELIAGNTSDGFQDFANQVAQLLNDDVIVATTFINDVGDQDSHTAVLMTSKGIVHIQPQAHSSKRYAQMSRVDAFSIYHSEHGKLAVVTEDDAIYPETFRLLSMQGVEAVFVPMNVQEAWLTQTGLTERAAENRVNIIAADSDPTNNLVLSLQKDFTLMTPWQEREFDGLLSAPVIHRGSPEQPFTSYQVNLSAAENKECSANTHLIKSRPWNIMDAML